MPLYLCVDCGGTKTSAVICDTAGTIVGRGSGGPSNITYLTVEAFITSISEAINKAFEESLPSDAKVSIPLISDPSFTAAWFGISGADSPAAIAKVTPAISSYLGIPPGPNLVVANDTHLLAAPVRMYPDVSHAVAVIAGTGSIAVSFVEEEGKIRELGRVGGWGWILGDEGGGYDVGRETLRQILLEEDRSSIQGVPSPNSKLRDRVLERFGVQSVMEILTGVYLPDPPAYISSGGEASVHELPREKRISSLPPLVFAAGFDDDDWLAMRILKICAGKLALQVALLLGRDGARSVNPQDAVISFGGSLAGVEQYRKMILDDLELKGHAFRRVHFIDDAAAVGAAGLAAAFSR